MIRNRNYFFYFFMMITLMLMSSGSASDRVDPNIPTSTEMDLELLNETLRNQTKMFEKEVKNIIKSVVKKILPTLMKYENNSPLSSKCTSSIFKFISGLTSAKTWALKMFDSISKPPAGILEGTLSDFGAFDQCLEIELPTKKGSTEFRGQYCAIEISPYLPPPPANFSMAKQVESEPLDTIGKYVLKMGSSFHYLKFRLGICIPSVCTLEEMQAIAKKVGENMKMRVKIPQCYTKKGVEMRPIHLAVICCLAILFILCASGSVLEYNMQEATEVDKKWSKWRELLLCFSFISNYKRLISPSGGAREIRALHGLRALSMAWVMFGHSYVWTNFQLLRRPERIPGIFRSFHFGIILNSWLSVEPFFLLSGLLTCYAVLKLLPKTGGKINIILYIFRRYLRLTPALLLVIGLLFFLPLISSGPFWYEVVDQEIDSCKAYWWRSITYISNWTRMKQICIHTTWYLSADFQLYVVSIVVFYTLYRSPKLGLLLIITIVIACNAYIGVLTYTLQLPPIIQITSGNNKQIEDTVDFIHMRTFTHAGAYYVGVIVGYLMTKYENIKMKKEIIVCGWCSSFVLAVTSLYGAHKWNIGEPHGLVVTSIFAALHRTTFAIGVAWVAFACVTGNGGVINKCLSSAMLAPGGRLTYMVYLLHSLVIWLRKASARERMYVSQYNILYEFIGNLAFTLVLAIPLYLLLEAPLLNLERMLFMGIAKKKASTEHTGHLSKNLNIFSNQGLNSKGETTAPTSVVLTSVTSIDDLNKSLSLNTRNN